ncbi:hypothetical protein Hanom_Chr02g00148961 [Helianthus anomalus]
MDGPGGLHFVTHLILNLDMLKPLDLLARTKCITKCKPHGLSVYFWKARDQIQNVDKSVHFTLLVCKIRKLLNNKAKTKQLRLLL